MVHAWVGLKKFLSCVSAVKIRRALAAVRTPAGAGAGRRAGRGAPGYSARLYTVTQAISAPPTLSGAAQPPIHGGTSRHHSGASRYKAAKTD